MGVGGNFSGSSDSSDSWQPAADLLEVENGFLIQMDLPGVAAGSVEAVLDGQPLTLRRPSPAQLSRPTQNEKKK
ncbi:MAG: hypothetical protein LIP23_02890, partial [Planctomycetes bacterium]|nr:hypothetical protein [Planctomycetota bacterium]